jgi:enamine deaminase RidA (YjgF/YER057c/UK114 family)
MAREINDVETANRQALNNLSAILNEISARLDAHDNSIETILENVADKRKTQAFLFAVTNDVSQMGAQSPTLTSRMVRHAMWPILDLDTDESNR